MGYVVLELVVDIVLVIFVCHKFNVIGASNVA